MKKLLTSMIGLSLASLAPAAVETWTNKSGKSIQLDLIKLTQKDGEVAGEFRMADGRTATIKASDLAQADAKRLAEAKPVAASTAPAAATPSVFDAFLDQLARSIAHVKRGGQYFTQWGIAAQHFDVLRVELPAARPLPYFGAQAGRQDLLAAQAPEPLDDDGQGQHRQQQDRHHYQATRLDQFQHASPVA